MLALTPSDHGVIDSTPEQFERQIRSLRHHFRILTLEEVEEAVTGRRPIRDCGALITFDDGYIDNCEATFPIPKSLGVQGTFFLATSYVGSSRGTVVGFDRVPGAPLAPRPHSPGVSVRPGVRASRRPGRGGREAAATVQIARGDGPATLPGVALGSLRLRRPARRPRAALPQLGAARGDAARRHGDRRAHPCPRAACQVDARSAIRRAATVARLVEGAAGNHRAVAGLPGGLADQLFASHTRGIAETGYRLAFSYYGGVNFAGTLDPYNLLRLGVERSTPSELFRLRTTLAAAGRQF